MRSSITSSLRIKEMGKIRFPLGKIEFWIHWEYCVYHRIFGQGKTLNIYINYLMLSPSRQYVKWKHLSIQIFINNDFMMNRELVLLWPEITLDIYLSAGGDLIFKLLSSKGRIWRSCWKLFLSLASWVMTYIMKMYCSWCITVLGYTCQIRKFGKFINIPSNTKFFRRSWITPLQKQPPEVF